MVREMSTSGLTNQYIPNTLDGLNVIEADQVYINGQPVELDNLVPYVGATQTLNMGSQNIQTSHIPSAPNDVINLTTLTDAVTFVDTSIALTYLNKITSSDQTVAGQVTFNKPVIINDSLTVNPTKTANLANIMDVSPNYKRNETDAGVTANYAFGSITNSGGVYTATTTDNFATLGLANLTANKLYKISIYVRALPTTFYTTSIQLYSSADGTTPVLSLDYSAAFIPTSTTFQLITGNFVIPVGYTKLILLCINTNNPTYVTPVEWYGLELFDMGVALTNASMPSQTADRVLVLNTNKQVVASGINTTKLGYLDNVSSDIQTQLNSKASTTYVDSQDGLRVLKTGDTMTGTLIMGGNKITTSYTPVNADDLTRKGYVDSAIAAIGSIYLPLAGGTMAGNITMNGNGFIGTVNISSSLDTTPLMKWASLANHITGGASEAYLFNGVNGYIAVARNTTRSATEANLHMGSVGADCSIESIASDGSVYLPMGYYGSYHYFNNKLGIGTTNMPLSGINFSNNGTGLNWGLGYSRILDDGDLRICTDDNMRFYSGSSTSTYGTQQMLLNSSGLSMNNTLYANSGVVWDTYGDNRIYNGNADNYSPGTKNNNLIIKSWWGIAYESYDGGVRINMNTRNGDAYFAGSMGIGLSPSYKLDVSGNCRISTTLDVGGSDHLRLSNEGSFRRIQSFGGIPLHINPLGNNVHIGAQNTNTNIFGVANVRGNSPYATQNGHMSNGSLTIGSGDTNYGWTWGWSGNTAGLLFECQDLTEIAVHDSGQRVASMIAYAGGAGRNTLLLGRDMSWGPSFVYTAARFSVATDSQYGHFNIYNPDGSNTHFGTSERTNYIRGGMTLFDTSTNSSWYLQHYLQNDGLRQHNAYGTWGVAIWAGATVVTQSWFGTVSDRRIKTNIKPVGSLLDVINKIEVVSFDFIDSVTHKRDECGVIAQQLEEVFPNAVDKSQGVIANIVQRATRYEVNDGKMTIEYKRSDGDELVVGCRVKLIIGSHEREADKHTNGDYIVKVLTVNANSIVVEWKEEFSMDGLSVVVYGKEVDDFRNVDKEQLAVMSIKGIQELSQQMDVIVQRNNVLEAWARQQEAKVKEQETKQRKMEKDMEKMASLISQLMGK